MTELRTPSVISLERGLILLEALAETRAGMGVSELARCVRLPKSSTHCLLVTLERHGYLERSEMTGRYMFSLKVRGLANLSLPGLKLREIALPVLRTLMRNTGLIVHMGILDRNEIVLIERVDPPGPLKLATWVGKRMDVHCTALGKALIAHWSEDELIELARNHPLQRHNDNTITSVRKLKEDLRNVQKVGYSVDDEEEEIGVRCIGCPVVGSMSGAISIAGTLAQLTADNVSALATKLKQSSAAISRRMGFTSADSTASQTMRPSDSLLVAESHSSGGVQMPTE